MAALKPYAALAVVVIGAVLIAFGPKQNVLQVASSSDELTYLFSGSDRLLFVSDLGNNPIAGGLTRTPTTYISASAFESQCDHWIKKFSAIVANGTSRCLESHRAEASSFVRGPSWDLGLDGFTAYVGPSTASTQ